MHAACMRLRDEGAVQCVLRAHAASAAGGGGGVICTPETLSGKAGGGEIGAAAGDEDRHVFGAVDVEVFEFLEHTLRFRRCCRLLLLLLLLLPLPLLLLLLLLLVRLLGTSRRRVAARAYYCTSVFLYTGLRLLRLRRALRRCRAGL
jgi:hypothetical protein